MAAVDLDRIGRASLKELGDIRIDDVLSFIDRGIEKMPSYMDLYRRWESQQWSVGDIDFSLDRQDWLEASDLDRKATLWSHRLFFNGEETDCHAEEISHVSIEQGEVKVRCKDAKEGWFTSHGIFKFPYGSLANAQLFRILMEKLVGVRING